MTNNKQKLKDKSQALIKFDFIFYSEKTPNVFQIDDNGNQISRPHIEVSRTGKSLARRFKSTIYKTGIYKYDGLKVDIQNPAHDFFKENTKGFFRLNENGQLIPIEN